jgi:hypothetical protein
VEGWGTILDGVRKKRHQLVEVHDHWGGEGGQRQCRKNSEPKLGGFFLTKRVGKNKCFKTKEHHLSCKKLLAASPSENYFHRKYNGTVPGKKVVSLSGEKIVTTRQTYPHEED